MLKSDLCSSAESRKPFVRLQRMESGSVALGHCHCDRCRAARLVHWFVHLLACSRIFVDPRLECAGSNWGRLPTRGGQLDHRVTGGRRFRHVGRVSSYWAGPRQPVQYQGTGSLTLGMGAVARGAIPFLEDRMFAAWVNAPCSEIVGKGGKGRHHITYQFRHSETGQISRCKSDCVCNTAKPVG